MSFQITPCRKMLFIAAIMTIAVPLQAFALPPKDFAGKRYIDTAGCIIEANGSRWTPRLLGNGEPDCGYPPTPFPAPASSGANADEQTLLSRIEQAEKRGDLIGLTKDRSPKTLPSLKSVSSELEAASSPQGGFMKGNLILNHRNSQLCDRIGQGRDDDGKLGDDPTRGFCSGAAPIIIWGGKRAEVKPAPQGKDHPATPAIPRKAAAKPATPAPREKPPATVKSGLSEVVPQTTEAMIPAGARYLLVGGYAEMATQIAKLNQLGLPLAKGRVGKSTADSLLVGPFSSRQAIVKAYDTLKNAGYNKLQPI